MSLAPYHQGYHMSTQSGSTSTPSTSRSSQNVLNSRVHRNPSSFQPNQYPQNNEEDTIMFTEGWTTCSLDDDDAYINDSGTAGQFTEWVYPPADELDHEQREYHLSYDTEPEDDVPDSMVASSSSASAASVFWSGSRSGVASTASTSVDSLGLHHVTLGSSGTDSPPGPVYDKTSTCWSFFFCMCQKSDH